MNIYIYTYVIHIYIYSYIYIYIYLYYMYNILKLPACSSIYCWIAVYLGWIPVLLCQFTGKFRICVHPSCHSPSYPDTCCDPHRLGSSERDSEHSGVNTYPWNAPSCAIMLSICSGILLWLRILHRWKSIILQCFIVTFIVTNWCRMACPSVAGCHLRHRFTFVGMK